GLTGTVYTVTFGGPAAHSLLPQMTAGSGSLQPRNTVQVLRVTGATGGTYRLGFDANTNNVIDANEVTAPLSYDAPPNGSNVPGGVSAAAGAAAGSLAAGTYFYVVTAVFGTYETLASAEVNQAAAGASTIQVQWNAVPGASSYRIYRGTAAGAENLYFPVSSPVVG